MVELIGLMIGMANWGWPVLACDLPDVAELANLWSGSPWVHWPCVQT